MVKPLVWGIIGGVIVVSFLIIVAFNYVSEYDDARLANINASYDYETDRLTVSIFLTDSNAEYTKANGNAEMTILKDGRVVNSATYNFVKDDFVSWINLFGGKNTAYVIVVREYFSSGKYDVYVDLNTKTRHWEDLHDSFYSLEPTQQQAPELTQQQAPESIQQQISEPTQQQAPEPTQRMIPKQTLELIPQSCSGSAGCFIGIVTRVVDGDTIHVDGSSIRFTLASTPELNEPGGIGAKQFVERICPVGSTVLVDEDDGQTEGSYGRMIAVIYCNGMNLNEAVIEKGAGYLDSGFCSRSEFSSEAWAQKYGCASLIQDVKPPEIIAEPTETKEISCDPSYPDVCIAPYPPDLDCGEIPYRNFKVLPPDPHRFDGDKDGIGCEDSSSQSPSAPATQPKEISCDPSYPTVCIPPYPPDLDCGEIEFRNFKVLPPDPHRFDGDKDGIGCES